MIELYAAHRFKRRKKEKSITIQGDVVLRGIPATVMPGNRYGVYTVYSESLTADLMWSTGPTEHKHPEANFRLFLLFVAETSQVRLSWMRVQ
jgi:hypothetical protein